MREIAPWTGNRTIQQWKRKVENEKKKKNSRRVIYIYKVYFCVMDLESCLYICEIMNKNEARTWTDHENY